MTVRRTISLSVALLATVVVGTGAAFGQSKAVRQHETAQRIVLVEIDDSTLRQLGRWPFKEDIHASAVSVLRGAHAELIIYNIVFTPRTPGALSQALAADGPPVVFPVVVQTQRFVSSPFVHFGYTVAQPNISDMREIVTTVEGANNPHMLVVAACLLIRAHPCPIEAPYVTLTAPSRPFLRIPFQALLQPPAALVSQLQNKIVIVGVAHGGFLSMRAHGATRASDPEVLGQAMVTLLSQ